MGKKGNFILKNLEKNDISSKTHKNKQLCASIIRAQKVPHNNHKTNFSKRLQHANKLIQIQTFYFGRILSTDEN